MRDRFRTYRLLGSAAAFAALTPMATLSAMAAVPDNGGPYDARFISGGIGVDRGLPKTTQAIALGAPFTISAWIKPDQRQSGRVTLILLGDPQIGDTRALVLDDGKLSYVQGKDVVTAPSALTIGQWSHIALSSDGKLLRLYVDGKRLESGAMLIAHVSPRIGIAPVLRGQAHFSGTLLGATVEDVVWTPAQMKVIAAKRPNFGAANVWNVGQGWNLQKTANIGQTEPQDAWTLPQGKGAVSAPVAKPLPLPLIPEPELVATGADRWQINGWRLATAPDVNADGTSLSRPGFDASAWHVATVPGTVLTTLVDRGIYPDPYFGLNNLQIPDSLARQDYWYRTSFTLPSEAADKEITLIFNGINYASEIWVNGARQGTTKGAFIRGQFDITPKAGENVIAVKVSPPPHPGIPHEQSIKAGAGQNGGQLAIDGPTFVATEGWDWIPGIRDRNTGIWLPVELVAHGAVRILDPHVVTDLPLPRTDSADIYITIPVQNNSGQPRQVMVQAGFGNVRVEKSATIAPGVSEIAFTPKEFSQLHVKNPKLWWPNGYGDPVLQTLEISALDGDSQSDSKKTRFGIREVSYDLSLFDAKGALRRVNVQTTDGGLKDETLIDVRHEAIKQSPNGWAESLTPAGEASSAVVDLPKEDTLPEPHLTLRVNGVKIAARGGNWGMDDAMKRIDRSRLEPYFCLQKEAHMNIIRNWMGTSTEEQFYDLADEYGLMVLNDFWQSTQNYQVEPQDTRLFLSNARDTISRYRNHPSIVAWFGRNEGVPSPLLNEELDKAVRELDGTRWYTGSSNAVNLQVSGPYNYRPPAGYFTDLASGFSVETGSPSLSTLESVEAVVPKEDLWPLSDTLAYHDWHFDRNGGTQSFMTTLDTMFGAATSFPDFERKAQMMNLETHKAIYEGFLGNLWSKNSGRLLWMTHPAWPSNTWQLYSWDYDPSAAYYGAKKAAEPLHIQLNLPGNELVVVNTTRMPVKGLIAKTRVVSLDNRELFSRTDKLDTDGNRAHMLGAVPLEKIFATDPMLLVQLSLTDATGKLLSDNLYWRGKDVAAYKALNDLPAVSLGLVASPVVVDGVDKSVTVTLSNHSQAPALNAKLTLVDDKGARILPAYYSDNYVALLPSETRTVTVRYPVSVEAPPSVRLRGWNITEAEVRAGQ